MTSEDTTEELLKYTSFFDKTVNYFLPKKEKTDIENTINIESPLHDKNLYFYILINFL